MEEKEYNGYYNYNVWNVMLYIDNDSNNYQRMWDLFKSYYYKKISYKQFLRGVNQIGAYAKSISDVKREKLSKIEIEKIRAAIIDNYREQAAYADSNGGRF